MKMNFNDLRDLLIFNIKYYRYVNNYSQERLAELSKLSPRYITDIERGLHCPTIPKIESIAKSLNIEPYQFFLHLDRDADLVNQMNQGRHYTH